MWYGKKVLLNKFAGVWQQMVQQVYKQWDYLEQ